MMTREEAFKALHLLAGPACGVEVTETEIHRPLKPPRWELSATLCTGHWSTYARAMVDSLDYAELVSKMRAQVAKP